MCISNAKFMDRPIAVPFIVESVTSTGICESTFFVIIRLTVLPSCTSYIAGLNPMVTPECKHHQFSQHLPYGDRTSPHEK